LPNLFNPPKAGRLYEVRKQNTFVNR